jgi:hypothetical protein
MQLIPIDRPDRFLAWNTRLDDDTDFLPLDPLALDYLGQQVGLWLFPALTTRTDRAQYFAVVLYGLALVERAAETYGERLDDDTRVALFERWERFWALSILESHGRRLERGHPDAFRGIRGASRAWQSGDKPLPLDYPLISRQQELGGLGAYLSSLRGNKLVLAGGYRPTPLARELVEAFWDEPDSSAHRSRFENYSLAALDRSRSKIDRKVSGITLAEVGRRARLSSLVERERGEQQRRLFLRVLEEAPPPTSRIVQLIEAAALQDLLDPELVLDEAIGGKLGPVAAEDAELLAFARCFGHMARETLDAFHALYGAIVDHGWVVSRARTIATVFTPERVSRLAEAAARFLDAALLHRFRMLPVHATGFVRLVTSLRQCTADDAFEAFLRFHADIQVQRRTGPAWIRVDGDQLVVDVTGYSGYRAEASFPNLRFGVVQRLLRDLGRLS